MTAALLITVQLHEPRYHGEGDWPPAPARLFQALLSGAARGANVPTEAAAWLSWLEGLRPPDVGAPRARRGQRVTGFVPNNDLDAVGGDPDRVADIRVSKQTRPWLIEGPPRLLYAWRFEPDYRKPSPITANDIASRLYQFGRGIDMAWAEVEELADDELASRLETFDGVIYRPTGGASGASLDCPMPGSMASLDARYAANLHRFEIIAERVIFRRPPKPRFQQVEYDAPPERALFELRSIIENEEFVADTSYARFPLDRASTLTTALRDGATDRLVSALPDRKDVIERTLRNRENPSRPTPRARILPVPSIGHRHTDRMVRRLLVEVPGDSPVRMRDVSWAFSGLIARDRHDDQTGVVVSEARLTPATDQSMLEHYGIGSGLTLTYRTWRTVTAAVLPSEAARRRVDPQRRFQEAKGGAELAREHAAAGRAVIQALRHAAIRAKVGRVHVQREPFEARGARAEAFAAGTRFDKTRLWHVEVELDRPIPGPVVIGDGRYAGLGLMAPVPDDLDAPGAHSFVMSDGLSKDAEPLGLAGALRRAVMARIQSALGRGVAMPVFFSGHEPDGTPSQRNHAHLAFHADLRRKRLLVLAPHLFRQESPTNDEIGHLVTLEGALRGFTSLTAGASGRVALVSAPIRPHSDRLFSPSRTWISITEYLPCRHAKRVSPPDVLRVDAAAELRRHGLPTARITVVEVRPGRRGGTAGRLRLQFRDPVPGPIALGRARHVGGGLFVRDS